MEKKILIVDDEIALSKILKDFLVNEGMVVCIASNGKEAYEYLASFKPTLVILDIMLPDDDGMEICRHIRNQSDIPILMLSAKCGDFDKIIALGLGADEYMTKPFSPTVVVAQTKAMLRRYQIQQLPTFEHQIVYKDFFMDQKQLLVKISDKTLQLVSKEFDLLWFLASHPGELFKKEDIYDAVWGMDEYGEYSTVTVHIRKIRAKLEQLDIDNEIIKTIWGVGYKFEL
jgi:DNA-binding response OmpR family regulator